MSKLNLSEAAAEILAQTAYKKGEPFGLGKKLAADEQGEVDIGSGPKKTNDAAPVGTKGVPHATPPGATPPVGSEPMKKLSPQPGQTDGRTDLKTSSETDQENPESMDDIRDRKPTPLKKTMQANKGSIGMIQKEGDEEEDDWEEYEDDEELQNKINETTMEEVEKDLEKLNDKSFMKKYGTSKKAVMAQLQKMQKEPEEKENCTKNSCKEDIEAMLSGETLSEEFKEKAALIFEAAVDARVEEISKSLEEQYLKEFEDSIETLKNDLTEKLDSYLDYVVESWIEENKLAIEKGLRTEIAEDFIKSLKNVFVEHYIDVPDEKLDLVEELTNKVDSLENQCNEEIQKNIQLKKTISEQKKDNSINESCKDLTLVQIEKIKSLAKNIEFITEEDFNKKLEIIKESYFPSLIKSASADSLNGTMELNENDDTASTKYVDPFVERMAKSIKK